MAGFMGGFIGEFMGGCMGAFMVDDSMVVSEPSVVSPGE
jgi:hypothetical protein